MKQTSLSETFNLVFIFFLHYKNQNTSYNKSKTQFLNKFLKGDCIHFFFFFLFGIPLEWENLQLIFTCMGKSSEGVQTCSTFRQLASNNFSLPTHWKIPLLFCLKAILMDAIQTSLYLFFFFFSHQNVCHMKKHR